MSEKHPQRSSHRLFHLDIQPERTGSLVRQLYLAGLLLILTLLGIWAIYALRIVLVILFFGLILAQALKPEVDRLVGWRLPRLVATLLVYLMLLVILGVVVGLVVPPLVREVADFLNTEPSLLDRTFTTLGPFVAMLQELGFVQNTGQIPAWITETLAIVAPQAFLLPIRAITLVLGGLAVIFVSIVMLTSGAETANFFLSFLDPRDRAVGERVFSQDGQRLGRYVRALLLMMTIIGVATYGGLVLLGVPFPLLLAVLAFFGEAVPTIGPIVTALPAMLFALTVTPILVVKVTVLYIVIQQVENYLLVPMVYSAQVRLHPLYVFVAILIGTSLMGILGAVLAVPVAATFQTLVEEIVVPWREARRAAVNS